LVIHPLAAFFFDDFDFTLELVVDPLVVGKPVSLQLHDRFQVRGRHLLVVGRHVAAGEGVFTPAQCGDAARKLTRLQAGRALEHHVFQHMGHTAGAIDLIHGAHTHPQHVGPQWGPGGRA
jgi:ATP adenylyltransferase/5',5'''-P-1,P-4-tetraphosphate phosphorylase II